MVVGLVVEVRLRLRAEGLVSVDGLGRDARGGKGLELAGDKGGGTGLKGSRSASATPDFSLVGVEGAKSKEAEEDKGGLESRRN